MIHSQLIVRKIESPLNVELLRTMIANSITSSSDYFVSDCITRLEFNNMIDDYGKKGIWNPKLYFFIPLVAELFRVVVLLFEVAHISVFCPMSCPPVTLLYLPVLSSSEYSSLSHQS